LRIGIAFDLAPTEPPADGPDDRYEEFDKLETVEAIADVLRADGHDVVLLGDGRELLEKVLRDPPDFVWNLAEGEGVGRCREARVPAVLEMLGIPYSGSDPLTLSVALDKEATHNILRLRPPRVPKGFCLPHDSNDSRRLAEDYLQEQNSIQLEPPFILKPAYEGSSKGITRSCVADTVQEAITAFDRLARTYQQPIMIEEFIAGEEVTVGIIGNGGSTRFLGSMKIAAREPTSRFVYSLEVKRDWRNRVEYETPAVLDSDVRDKLHDEALHIYWALACRDLARLDFRIRDGEPVFLEINPLPGLAPGTSDLVLMAQGYGIGHAQLVRMILDAALTRVGLASCQTVAP
jgi:D-alanine-D-alanine ligase